MSLDTTKTVRELAVEIPSAARIFEKLRIDYCCGGHKPLAEACAQAGVEVEQVARLLTEDGQSAQPSRSLTGFQAMPLAELATYIVKKHHACRRQPCKTLSHSHCKR